MIKTRSNITNNIYTISARKLLYIIALSLWVFQEYLSNSYYSIDMGYRPIWCLKIVSIIIFLIEYFSFSRIYKLNAFWKLIVMIMIVAIATYTSGTIMSTSNLIVTFLILLCSEDSNFRDTCRCFFWTELICTVFIISSAKLGIITNIISTYEGRIRDYLGGTYVGFLPIRYINIFFCGLYVYAPTKKNLLKHWFIIPLLLLGTFYFYIKTDTRQSFYITLVGIFLYLLFTLSQKKIYQNKIIGSISILAYPVLCIATYLLSYGYNPYNPIMWEVNQFVSGRIQFNKRGLQQYNLHLFGNVVEYNMGSTTNNFSDYFYIDSGYVATGIRYGLLFLALLIIIYMFLISKAIKEADTVLYIWLLLLAIYNVLNNMMFSLTVNATLCIFPILALNSEKILNLNLDNKENIK